jgi:hypothetical protein
VHELPEHVAAAIARIEVAVQPRRGRGKGKGGTRQRSGSTKIKLLNKLRALEMLFRHIRPSPSISHRKSPNLLLAYPLGEFLEDFPTVSREQAVAALEQAKQALLARENPS